MSRNRFAIQNVAKMPIVTNFTSTTKRQFQNAVVLIEKGKSFGKVKMERRGKIVTPSSERRPGIRGYQTASST